MMFGQYLKSHRILKRIAKTLIRLRVCAGWSEALLVAHTILLEIQCRGSYVKKSSKIYSLVKEKCKTLIQNRKNEAIDQNNNTCSFEILSSFKGRFGEYLASKINLSNRVASAAAIPSKVVVLMLLIHSFWLLQLFLLVFCACFVLQCLLSFLVLQSLPEKESAGGFTFITFCECFEPLPHLGWSAVVTFTVTYMRSCLGYCLQ